MDHDPKPPRLDVGTATHRGGRSENQDVVGAGPSWVAVADGIGGHAGGRQAATLTVDAAARALGDAPITTGDALVAAAHEANEAVRAGQRRDVAVQDMGSTLTLAGVVSVGDDEVRCVVANVGDSPGWHLSSAGIELITTEHSMAAELVAAGVITAEHATDHPARHVVTRAIGLEDDLQVDERLLTLAATDALILASDGVEVVHPSEIADIVTAAATAQEAATSLVEEAVRRGATDNVTVAVVKMQPRSQEVPSPL